VGAPGDNGRRRRTIGHERSEVFDSPHEGVRYIPGATTAGNDRNRVAVVSLHTGAETARVKRGPAALADGPEVHEVRPFRRTG